MSVAKMGNTQCLGHHHSEETKAKMSAAQTGKPKSDATRAKMSKPKSDATRAKMSVGQTGPLNNNWKGGKRVFNAKHKAKRRELGFLPLNQSFPGSDFHHLDIDHGVFIPHTLHQSVSHDHNTGLGMEQINALALAYAGLTADVLDDALPFD